MFQGCEQTCTLLQKERLSLSSKAVLYINILEKVIQNKEQTVSLLARSTEMQDTCGELSLNLCKLT